MPDTYEPEGGNTPAPSTSPAPHHVRPVLFVLLGATIIVALGVIALLRSPDAPPASQQQVALEQQQVDTKANINTETGNPTAPAAHVLAGQVAEVNVQEGEGSRIVLTVSAPKAPSSAEIPPETASNTEPVFVPLEMETVSYRFFIADGVDGSDALKGTLTKGMHLVVYFDSEPSETEYVSVVRVEALH